MAQIKTFTWSNSDPAIARNLDVGFQVAEIITVDVTNGGSWYWNSEMSDGYALDVDAGTVATSNGFTPLSQGAMFGAAITGFTNANPGVIAASNLSQFSFAAGDTVKVGSVADDGSASNGLNGEFTVASVDSAEITLVENTSSYSVYVSGGYVSRVSDANGDPVSNKNVAIQGITVGTTPVGQASAVMTAVVRGQNSVT